MRFPEKDAGRLSATNFKKNSAGNNEMKESRMQIGINGGPCLASCVT
jgi:hypothetical protein